jgi:N-methylhydantoinase B
MADGVDTGGIIINTTANIPSIEQTEAEYPVLYHFRRQLRDSGGAGRYRGGMSAGVAISPHDQRSAMESSFSGVGAEIPNAYGLGGGLPGATVRYLRWTGAGAVDDLARDGLPADVTDVPGARAVRPVNSSHNDFPADAVEYHNWQGGGGYGDPLDREPALVLADVRDEAVSEEAALSVYGVVLGPDGVDAAATSARREAIRQARLTSGRPAADVLGERVAPARVTGAHGGTLRYGDVVAFDLAADEARCLRCSFVLGPATADFKLGCLLEEGPPTGAGPIRGEDYETAAILRRFHCPGCGRQLETEVTVPGAPRATFTLAGAA